MDAGAAFDIVGGKETFAASAKTDTGESEKRHDAECNAVTLTYGLDCRCNFL
jgi:hypothetical protein